MKRESLYISNLKRKRMYVEAYSYAGVINNANHNVWTLSFVKGKTGWETDCGYPGYGLQKEVAEAIAEKWNEGVENA